MTIPKRFKDKREQRKNNPVEEDINDDPWEHFEPKEFKKKPEFDKKPAFRPNFTPKQNFRPTGRGR